MKTSAEQIIAGRQEIGLRLLDWSGGRPVGQLRRARREKVPELRIVGREEGEALFKYAITARKVNGFWETLAYAALGVVGVGALVMAFL